VSKKVLIGIVALSSLVLSSCGDKKAAPPAGGGAGTNTAAKPTASPGEGQEVKLDAATAGVIKGMVKFANAPDPMPKVLDMGDKTEQCGTKAAPKTDEWYVVGENGAAANCIVYVKDGPATKVRTPVPTTEAVVDQMNCMYTPRTLAIRAGQPIRFKSDDPTPHNIHLLSKVNPEWNMTMNANSSFLAGEGTSQKVTNAEVAVKLKCDIHPWMAGNLGVFNHDAFYVTKKDGMFELKNLPPGDYEVMVYHERAKAKPAKITVGPKETKEHTFELKFEN
jgi:plastocyanin